MAFDTTLALAQYVEKELGHQLSGASSQRTDIVSHLDRAHKIVLSGGGYLNYDETGKKLNNDAIFSFARAQNPKVLTLKPAITDVTVTINRDSNSVTMNAAPDGANSIAGFFMRVQGEQEVYRIDTHTAATTSAAIDGVYVGTANVSAATAEFFKLHYDLGDSDILRLVSPLVGFDNNDSISLVDKESMLEQFPLRNVGQGFPSLAAIVLESAGTLTLQMSAYPDDLKRVECDYVPIPTTLDTTSSNPIIPAQFRLVLAHMTLYHMLLRNDDNRAGQHMNIARSMFMELVEWNEKLSSSADADYGRVVMNGPAGGRKINVINPID